jgi:hypothetical protein
MQENPINNQPVALDTANLLGVNQLIEASANERIAPADLGRFLSKIDEAVFAPADLGRFLSKIDEGV